ncbi:PREDICTED: hyoscyamine 6-dioxygenase-like [Prunus mume]|uniref:Hyoscyamine 6-dioxygenase-like n=1 Tax=Prunus mume TaxID=102107 RepID=A0ABM0NAT7_PRUMU|nr:PREDICTED: hyoscyamine 6-dioxygenase-like [Prunus mume]
MYELQVLDKKIPDLQRLLTPRSAWTRLATPPHAFPALNVQIAKQPDASGVFLPPRADARSDAREGMPLKTLIHRAVTNIVVARLSLAMFYGPNKDTVIGPIEDLIDEEHPPLYRSYKYAEFFEEFFKQEGKRRLVKEAFELHN